MTRRSIALAVTHEVTALSFYRGYLSYLKDRGWAPTIIASDSGRLAAFARSEGVRHVSVPMERDPAPLTDLQSLLHWFAALRSIRPDVLVVATPKASLLGMVSGRLVGVPVRVYQMWGLRLESEQGLKRKILRSIERLTIRMSTEVVCNSDSLAAAALREGILGTKKPVVLGRGSSHGVDTARFSPCADHPPLPRDTKTFIDANSGRTIFGFVGRVHPDKGVDVLLDALRHCVAKGDQVACILVGPFESSELKSYVENQQESLPIHIAGPTDDPRPYMADFDVLCLPSKREGFPNVVLEAAAMSVPAIVSDATGCVDSVLQNETGMVVQAGSAESLASAMRTMAGDPARRLALGIRAREWVAENFRQEHVWSLQEDLLSAKYSKSATLSHQGDHNA